MELQNACASQDAPSSQFNSEASPRTRNLQGRPRRPLGATWHHCCYYHTHAWDSHLLGQEPGHQQITAQTSVQRLEPLAFSGSRLENVLRREPRSQQHSAPLTFSHVDACLNKCERYKIRRSVLLVMVIGICRVLGHTLLSKTAFKNPRSEVFSFPLWKLQRIN